MTMITNHNKGYPFEAERICSVPGETLVAVLEKPSTLLEPASS